jgi:hypothetical protein
MNIPIDLTSTQALELACGFLFVMWMVALSKKPKEKRWYETVVDSKLHIEREA